MELYRREENSCSSDAVVVNESALIDAYKRALGGVQVELRSSEQSTSLDDKNVKSAKQPEPNTNPSKTRSVGSLQRELISYADLFDDDPQPASKPQKSSKPAKKREGKSGDVKKKNSEALPNVSDAVNDTASDHVAKRASSASWKWSVGDFCVASFTEDGEEYPARVISIDPDAQTCVVHYLAYENEEVQPLSALRRIYEQSPCESACASALTQQLDATTSICGANKERSAEVASSSQFSHSTAPFALPQFGVGNESVEQNEAFGNMLNAWYTAGYQTGFYLGLKHAAESERKRMPK